MTVEVQTYCKTHTHTQINLDSTCMDPLLDDPDFRCRKCRFRLFFVKQLESHGDQQDQNSYAASPTDLSIYDKCSSWFLRDDEMLPWITESVEKV